MCSSKIGSSLLTHAGNETLPGSGPSALIFMRDIHSLPQYVPNRLKACVRPLLSASSGSSLTSTMHSTKSFLFPIMIQGRRKQCAQQTVSANSTLLNSLPYLGGSYTWFRKLLSYIHFSMGYFWKFLCKKASFSFSCLCFFPSTILTVMGKTPDTIPIQTSFYEAAVTVHRIWWVATKSSLSNVGAQKRSQGYSLAHCI